MSNFFIFLALLISRTYERGGSVGTLFWGPIATQGPETEGQARNQLETPRRRRVYSERHIF